MNRNIKIQVKDNKQDIIKQSKEPYLKYELNNNIYNSPKCNIKK